MLATKIMNSSGNKIPGFTFIEIIATLVIIGVTGTIAVSMVSSKAPYDLAAEVEILKGHLRYAQTRAMSDTVSWGITLSANSYTLQTNGVTATSNLPNEDSATHSIQAGVAITQTGTTITFNQFGSPGATTLTITLSADGNSQSINIIRNTGFIS